MHSINTSETIKSLEPALTVEQSTGDIRSVIHSNSLWRQDSKVFHLLSLLDLIMLLGKSKVPQELGTHLHSGHHSGEAIGSMNAPTPFRLFAGYRLAFFIPFA